jgi:hypothetical protein
MRQPLRSTSFLFAEQGGSNVKDSVLRDHGRFFAIEHRRDRLDVLEYLGSGFKSTNANADGVTYDYSGTDAVFPGRPEKRMPVSNCPAAADDIANHASLNAGCGIMPLHVHFRRLR